MRIFKTALLISFCLLPLLTYAQTGIKSVESMITRSEVEAHLRFLAADELMGRRTGEEGNNIAARYIASYFEAFGLKKAPGAAGYFQSIAFEEITPPKEANLNLGEESRKQGKDFVMVQGREISVKEEVVFAGYGIIDENSGRNDYEGLDVKGKIVVVNLGLPDADDPRSAYQAMGMKRKLAADKGAVALIELYRLSMPWRYIAGRLRVKRLQVASGENTDLPYAWLRDDKAEIGKALQNAKNVKWELSSSASKHKAMPSQNVIGWIQGTDPGLNKEYVLLSAHYDHVGTGKKGGRVTEADSIFNGARDNGIGTTALLAAAKSLSMNPPKRSVIFLAVTGEELGMLGSRYYSENPLFPLNQTVFNLNSDGAGYNDTTLFSVVGFDHVAIEALVAKAAGEFGMKAGGDPVPQQNLYERSDNISFASRGIPAINASPGVSDFDQELMKYYHQVADEASSLNFSYLHRFCQAYARLAAMIANGEKTPWWHPGNKFEAEGKKLFGKD